MNPERLIITYTPPMNALTQPTDMSTHAILARLARIESHLGLTAPTPAAYTPTSTPIGIVIGHGRQGDSGAVSLDGTTEWQYNEEVANAIQDLCPSAVIIPATAESSYAAHQREVTRRLKAKKVSCALELHFNAFDGNAKGFEYLFFHQHFDSQRLAQHIRDVHATRAPNGFNRGVKSRDTGSRGALFLAPNDFPRVICEPFFGDNRVDWDTYKNAHRDLARIYLDGLTAAGYLEKA